MNWEDLSQTAKAQILAEIPTYELEKMPLVRALMQETWMLKTFKDFPGNTYVGADWKEIYMNFVGIPVIRRFPLERFGDISTFNFYGKYLYVATDMIRDKLWLIDTTNPDRFFELQHGVLNIVEHQNIIYGINRNDWRSSNIFCIVDNVIYHSTMHNMALYLLDDRIIAIPLFDVTEIYTIQYRNGKIDVVSSRKFMSPLMGNFMIAGKYLLDITQSKIHVYDKNINIKSSIPNILQQYNYTGLRVVDGKYIVGTADNNIYVYSLKNLPDSMKLAYTIYGKAKTHISPWKNCIITYDIDGNITAFALHDTYATEIRIKYETPNTYISIYKGYLYAHMRYRSEPEIYTIGLNEHLTEL